MKIELYQIDAFTDSVFSGNPAAVCPLEAWPGDALLQNIAAENNLAETAYFVKSPEGFRIRWFTPMAEVDLCGHATLASAYVLFNFLGHNSDSIAFQSRSGILKVTRTGEWLTLNFPADKLQPVDVKDEMKSLVGMVPVQAYRGSTDLMIVFENYSQVQTAIPDLRSIASLKGRGLIITAPGNDTDFVSRFFAPQVGVNEDPVTGSAHTTLVPFWSKKLGRDDLTARQLSKRSGYLKCKMLGDRVEMSGRGAFYMKGLIEL